MTSKGIRTIDVVCGCQQNVVGSLVNVVAVSQWGPSQGRDVLSYAPGNTETLPPEIPLAVG